MFTKHFYSLWCTRITLILVLAICAAALYFRVFTKPQGTQSDDHILSVKSEDDLKLDFIPKKQNFSCDDLFIDSEVDSFNFSDHYYQDLPLFDGEIKRVNKFSADGHSAMFPAQYKTIHYLASTPFVNSICETGFNYGHSSFAFLTAKKDNKVLSFDIGHHDYTPPLMKYLEKTYPSRFRYVIGDSTKALPIFISENPSYKCNMFFVDGSHTYEIAYSDLKNFRRLSEGNNIIVLDDFPTRQNFYDNQVGKAWQRAKDEKMVKEYMSCVRKTDKIRGFTIGRFI